MQDAPTGKDHERILSEGHRGGRPTLGKGRSNSQTKKNREDTVGEGGERKTLPDEEALEQQISDLRNQLDHAAQTIVAKDNVIEGLDKDKDNLQHALHQAKQQM